MFINIFLAEDDKYYVNHFRKNIEKWAKSNDIYITMKIYNKLTYDLVNLVSKYDICFLDISISPVNGIEFARVIRQYNQDLEIVFVTNYKDFALQGYKVKAHYYILKPIKYHEISDCMNQLLRKLSMKKQKRLIFKSNSSLFCYNISEIVYIEANLHSTIIKTLQQEIQSSISFKQANERLEYPPFYQIHRSYTVNLMHVVSIKEGMWSAIIKVES